MSRLKRFADSLFSTYLFLVVNGLYTLASVPIALKYLSKAEFGLWALTTQIAGYIALVDLGMGSSVARIVIDHKDQRENGRYGSVIKAGLLVGVAQAAIILTVGMGLIWFLGGWLKVLPSQAHDFLWLMIGQLVLTAGVMVSRVFGQVLYAWQRIDVYNYVQMAQLVIAFAVLWAGFRLGFGVFSLLAGTMAGWVCSTITFILVCQRLGLWPRTGEWGPISRDLFRELFNYGADAFLIAIGSQIILSSQSLLVSRQLGPVEVAIWAVMTKAFAMVGNVIWRVIFNSMPAMAEMQVRGEHERLWDRYRALFVTVNVFAGICAVLFAACNSAFVTIWTHGEISWSPINDVLLGAWFLALTQQSCFNTLILYLKETRNLKYIYLIEGLVFVGVSLIVVRRAGITGMLVCSLCGTILFTWACGLWKVARLANKNLKVFLWEWQQPVLQILGFLIPCWLIARWLLNGASTWVQLVVLAGLLGGTGVIISIRFILPRPLITEIAGKLPAPMRRATLLLLWDNPVDHQKGC